jgi:hypothetical protein
VASMAASIQYFEFGIKANQGSGREFMVPPLP